MSHKSCRNPLVWLSYCFDSSLHFLILWPLCICSTFAAVDLCYPYPELHSHLFTLYSLTPFPLQGGLHVNLKCILYYLKSVSSTGEVGLHCSLVSKGQVACIPTDDMCEKSYLQDWLTWTRQQIWFPQQITQGLTNIVLRTITVKQIHVCIPLWNLSNQSSELLQ